MSRTIRIFRMIPLLGLIVAAGCQDRPDAQEVSPAPRAAATLEPTATGSDPEVRRRFRAEAAEMVRVYSEQLKAALGEAVADGGTAHAIAVCAEKAPEIARDVSTGSMTIRRIGTRVRNAETNEPTPAQRAVLERLTQATPEHVGELDGTLTYMKAITIQDAVCLKCHGPRESIEPDVFARLDMLYPDDQATGYRQGDLRGAFVVELR